MTFSFWNMIPGDAFFEELDKLPEGRQKRYFLMIAEECLMYNREYDASFTFGEFKQLYYPGGFSSNQCEVESEEEDRVDFY